MKVILASDTFYPNVDGASVFVQRLAKGLAENHEVFVIAASKNGGYERYSLDKVQVFGVPSWSAPTQRSFRFPYPFIINSSVRKFVDTIKPDIIHIQNHVILGKICISYAQSNDVPIVGTNHFMPENLVHHLRLPKALGKVVSKLMWADFCKTYSKLDAVTTPTATAARLLVDQGFTAPVTTISCGIDTNVFKTSSSNVFRDKYNLDDKPTLLSVCRLEKEKNVDLTIKAFALLKDKNYQLIIAGKGSLKSELESLAFEKLKLKNVVFLGFVPDEDLPALYGVSDCFIAAGEAELQCLAALEAAASSLPLLVLDELALKELVEPNVNRYIFNKSDVPQISGYIDRVLSNKQLAQEMGRNSLAMAQRHSYATAISNFENLYTSTIRKKASR